MSLKISNKSGKVGFFVVIFTAKNMPNCWISSVVTQPDMMDSGNTKTYDLSFGTISRNLEEFRATKVFCDVELIANGKSFHVHKVLLAAASDYFKIMFSSEKDQKTIELQPISPNALQLLLDAIYLSRITLHLDNIEEALRTGDFFRMSELTEACAKFLLEVDKTVETAIKFLKLAEKYDLNDVVENYFQFILGNFGQIVWSSSFLELPPWLLCAFISNDNLCVTYGEIEVFRAALRFLGYGKNADVKTYDVLKHVRFPQIPPAVLKEEVCKNEMVRKCPSTSELLEEAMKFHADEFSKPVQDGPQFVCRGETRILVIPEGTVPPPHGHMQGNNCKLHFLNKGHDGEFSETDILEAPFAFLQDTLSAVTINNYLFLFGTLESTATQFAKRFDPQLQTWLDLQNPEFSVRIGAAVARHKEEIYFTGGNCQTLDETTQKILSDKATDEVWIYSITRNSWDRCIPLPKALVYHGMVNIGSYIYVAGGAGGNNWEPSANLYCYDVERKLWSDRAEMKKPRFAHCLEVVRGNIYAFGGGVDGFRTLEVEVYNISVNQWTILKNTTIMHCWDSQSLVIDDEVYIIGGFVHGEKNNISCFNALQKEVSAIGNLPFKTYGGISALLTIPRK